MFLSRNKKNNVYPYKPQFYYIKVGFKGVKILQVCFRDVTEPGRTDGYKVIIGHSSKVIHSIGQLFCRSCNF